VQEVQVEVAPEVAPVTAAPVVPGVETGLPSSVQGAEGGNGIAVQVRREFRASYRVDPAYPRQAQHDGLSGTVVARVYVAPAGNVTRVEIVSSPNRAFDREVVRALSQWRFNPESVGFVGEYEIAFRLTD
jgi:protein TonB